jgi:hypothetical protein
MESSATDEGEPATPSFNYRIALFSFFFFVTCTSPATSRGTQPFWPVTA